MSRHLNCRTASEPTSMEFKAAPYHCLRDVPQMGQAEGKEGQILFTVKGYTFIPTRALGATV